MFRIFLAMLVCAALAAPVAAAESVFSSYRGVALGDPVAAVVDELTAALTDVKVVHERPTLVQQLTWRPHRFISGATLEPDPLGEIVLTFHLGRLARISATYDRDRTEGLTDVDLHDALALVYGTSMLPSSSLPTAPSSATAPAPIGRWGDNDTLVVLSRDTFQNRVRLTITSVVADRAMQEAIADGVSLERREAPARDLARREADAAALRARDEAVRRDNKAAFKP